MYHQPKQSMPYKQAEKLIMYKLWISFLNKALVILHSILYIFLHGLFSLGFSTSVLLGSHPYFPYPPHIRRSQHFIRSLLQGSTKDISYIPARNTYNFLHMVGGTSKESTWKLRSGDKERASDLQRSENQIWWRQVFKCCSQFWK